MSNTYKVFLNFKFKISEAEPLGQAFNRTEHAPKNYDHMKKYMKL